MEWDVKEWFIIMLFYWLGVVCVVFWIVLYFEVWMYVCILYILLFNNVWRLESLEIVLIVVCSLVNMRYEWEDFGFGFCRWRLGFRNDEEYMMINV